MTRTWRLLTGEDRVLLGLAAFVPVTVAADRLHAAPALTFFLSVIAVVPLAGLIGSATDALAGRIGARAGGLLNATFGNAPDLLVGVFGLQKGLIPVVKATLIGALISNSALIMGICCLVAGLLHRRPTFRRAEAGHHSVLMLLALAGIAFPSAASFVLCGSRGCAGAADRAAVLHASVGIAAVLLLAYAAYMAFGIFGLESLRGTSDQRPAETRQVRGERDWPLWLSIGLLAAATLLLLPVTDILTGSVQMATRAIGWTDVFVGIIVIANAGNVAEGYAAVKFAFSAPGSTGGVGGAPPDQDSGLDLALGIASASSIQIATMVAPLIVLYGLTQHPMNLVFSPIELTILALLVLVFNNIAHDGESHWLEGAQLIALYAMAAVIFFVLPAGAFGG